MITDIEKLDFDLVRQKRNAAKEQKNRLDSLIYNERSEDHTENMHLIEEARNWWDSLHSFREKRRRVRNYNKGDQWKDLITDPTDETKLITEEDYIKSQGKVPLKQNLIRNFDRNLVGQFRNSQTKSVVLSRTKGGEKGAEMLTNAIEHVHNLNYKKEIDARAVEEFALGGMVIQKNTYKYYKNRDQEDIDITNVNVNRFFFNTDVSDIRIERELRICGEIIDCPIDNLVAQFAKSPEEEQVIRDMYKITDRASYAKFTGLDSKELDSLDFFVSSDPNKARLYEIWSLKSEWRTMVHDTADASKQSTDLTMAEIDQLNQARIDKAIENGIPEEEVPLMKGEPFKEQYWHVKFLTPYGHTLWEGETPYQHQEPPFVIMAHPMIDGDVWGFLHDILDQQRHINRIITLQDFIMSASAKGVLMIPEDMIPDNMNPEEFADEWRSFNGVIVYKPSTKHNRAPQQISANSTAAGSSEMLRIQLELINDISGIHGAAQGKTAASGTPAALYAQEAQNAATNTLDFFHTFSYFVQKRDEKVLSLILQYYTEERYFAISGEGGSTSTTMFDPTQVNGHKYDLQVAQSNDTPVYRSMVNDILMKLLELQMIDVEVFLDNSTMPFASQVLDSIKNQKRELQENGTPPDMSQVDQAIPPGDEQAMKLAKQAVAA